VTRSFCVRFSVAVLIGTTLLHVALGAWLGATCALLLVAPSLVLTATIWLMRIKWIVWLAFGALLVMEGGAVAAYLASDAQTGSLLLTAFAVAASAVQIPIGFLVAVVSYFQKAD
jgi:hypothetical protein